ncbi:MAG: sulfite exporter TauE/SafE family protein [Cytophagales bacterium]|nr:sulfite exporter TauE/SafE family protein [Cytophagales bacterium]
MTGALLIGLSIGFVGSWHCIGMCGPLAMALPYRSANPLVRLLKSLLYTLGRTLTYVLVGLLLASVGEGFALAGFQRSLSLIVGLVLVAIVLFPSFNKRLELSVSRTRLGRFVQQRIARLYQSQRSGTFFLVGMLNGLLPCGMVYMAAFAALGSADTISGILIMTGFGLGTLPLMTSFTLLPVREWLARFRGMKVANALMLVAGAIMILRATALELPDVPVMGVFNPSQLTICK